MLERSIQHKQSYVLVGRDRRVATKLRRFHEGVPDGLLLDDGQARQHGEIVHICRANS